MGYENTLYDDFIVTRETDLINIFIITWYLISSPNINSTDITTHISTFTRILDTQKHSVNAKQEMSFLDVSEH